MVIKKQLNILDENTFPHFEVYMKDPTQGHMTVPEPHILFKPAVKEARLCPSKKWKNVSVRQLISFPC